jgi:hypothetical protein
MTPAFAANTPGHIRGIGAVLEVVSTGRGQGILERRGPLFAVQQIPRGSQNEATVNFEVNKDCASMNNARAVIDGTSRRNSPPFGQRTSKWVTPLHD